jgi:hypothetical protein
MYSGWIMKITISLSVGNFNIHLLLEVCVSNTGVTQKLRILCQRAVECLYLSFIQKYLLRVLKTSLKIICKLMSNL